MNGFTPLSFGWKLSNTLLNKSQIKREITKKIQDKYLNNDKEKCTSAQKEFIFLYSYVRNNDCLKSNDLSFYLMKLDKRTANQHQRNMRRN